MPAIFIQKSPAIGIWKIEESWQEMSESLRINNNYSRVIEHYLNNIKSDKRKQEWLAVRLLLAYLAGTEAYIDYLENGAPVLRNSPYNISISHTTGFAAVILSNKEHPGIDIEYHSGRALKLCRKYLGAKELELFDSLRSEKPASFDNHSKQTKLATICWCAKETAYKALGLTEVDFINHLHILPFTFSCKGTFALQEKKSPNHEIFNINYQVTEDYIITWKE